ncbi:MAG: serine/threonine protein phosphatase [Bacteroidetes bacterium]|nr:MAG: serine/threonine protein phosphatase [Bacteroidota bacterium]
MDRLFAISDIHGCFKPFYELVVNIIRLKKTDHLILLGDYIDRGDQSKEVIDFIIDLTETGFNITSLKGNHEVMIADAHEDPAKLPLWLMNSGMSTLLSFSIKDISELDNQYLEFFKKLEYYKTLGNFIFVHAGFDDYAADPFSVKHSMVWDCGLSYNNPVLSRKTIIHGHRPEPISHVQELISKKSKVIPVDTGCVYDMEPGYGNLSALEVHSMTLFSVPNQ